MTENEGSNREKNEQQEFRRMVVNGWIIVCTMAFLFIAYGFFALFIVGDKGVPDWDYGSVKDVPAESAYSTYPYRGRIPEPEPQHVNQTPSAAAPEISGGHFRSSPPEVPENERRSSEK